MSIVPTHAGDDSDGKIRGIESVNILFMLAGLLASIGLAFLLSRMSRVPDHLVLESTGPAR